MLFNYLVIFVLFIRSSETFDQLKCGCLCPDIRNLFTYQDIILFDETGTKQLFIDDDDHDSIDVNYTKNYNKNNTNNYIKNYTKNYTDNYTTKYQSGNRTRNHDENQSQFPDSTTTSNKTNLYYFISSNVTREEDCTCRKQILNQIPIKLTKSTDYCSLCTCNYDRKSREQQSIHSDILVNKRFKNDRRSRRAATARPERLWEHGVIPYEIESNFSGEF